VKDLEKDLQLKIPPVAQALLAALLMWLLHRLFSFSALGTGGLFWLAMIPGAAGAFAGLAGVIEFRREQTTVDPRVPENAAALVTGGIYRYTRNPMYVGLFLMLAGWGLYLGAAMSFLVLPLFLLTMDRLQIQAEERHMLALFGEEYARYCERVHRWI